MSFFTIHSEGFTWTGEGEYLQVDAWGPDSVRVRASRMHEPQDTQWALLDKTDLDHSSSKNFSIEKVETNADTNTEILRLSNGNIVVTATAQQVRNDASGYPEFICHLDFARADGTSLITEITRGGSLNLRAREYLYHSHGGYGARVSFETPTNEHLYGMGEYQQNIIDLKGCSLELAHRNSQASVPFVVSSEGYGFLWNNPAIGRVSFGTNKTVWEAESTRQIDYWITVADSPADIERNYANVTGHSPQMPEWGLGFWQCKLRYWNQEQLLDVARRFKAENIPLDLIVADFFHWPYMGDFRFEEEFWPDPQAMCDELHEMGVKLMVSVWPQVSMKSENFATMRQKNLLVSADRGEDIGMMFEGPSQFYDATNPQARKFVWDKCNAHYASYGVDAFWLDEAEPEYGVYSYDNYRYWAGPNIEIGNIFPVEYNRGFYEGQLEIGRENEIVNLTRCAWAGSQRYGALVWSGDVGSTFEDLKAQITCAIHMGMAGIPWFTTDMGGFHDGDISSDRFRNLFVRWCQFSCFSPVMRNHGDRSYPYDNGLTKEMVSAQDGTWRAQSGAENEPWSMGEEVQEILTKFIRIREILRPYTRELFEEAHTDGQPLVRGLFYEFPQDSSAATIADEYMFGPDLLVAPVVAEFEEYREVYLPGDESTQWTSLIDGAIYHGGNTIAVHAPMETIPVFARNGKDHGLLGKL
ncbi:glycoside hydrolase family 31 protein [Alloscardovia criceti]|uniref:glycoside hydrolase family 31 protein n=1 Tax=Alloscardovia criceti TaxID=356828 RepID=UPI00036B64C2|nr:TIM-barrel domain-containing protein [Alloscardovia criceti]